MRHVQLGALRRDAIQQRNLFGLPIAAGLFRNAAHMSAHGVQ
jgi:hypothetical protein